MDVECPNCRRTLELKQSWFHHAGFSNQGFLYCDRDSTVVVFSTYDPTYVRIVGNRTHPWMLGPDQKAQVEERLRACPYGGSFSFNNPPQCPHYCGSIQAALPSPMHYAIVGRLIDGDREKIWNDWIEPARES